MLSKVFSGRWAVALATLVVAALVAGGVLYITRSGDDKRTLCAYLPDSAGLYAGNAVNIRGVKVGKVSGISAADGAVKVTMEISDRPVNPALSVLAVNNSVLADRRIELIGTEGGGAAARARSTSCVPRSRSFTPISVSTAFQSFTTMFDQLGGPGDDAEKPVSQLISAAQSQFAGTGEDINKSVNNLAGFMADPDEFLSQLCSVFDNLAVLTDVAGQNWDALRDIRENSADLTHFMGALFKSFVYIFDGLGAAGPGLDDLLVKRVPVLLGYSGQASQVLDLAVARAPEIATIFDKLPGIATGLSTAMNRSSRSFRLSFRSPKVVARTPNSAVLCAALNRAKAGSCDPRSPDLAAVDLADVVTGAIQGGR